jgi:hypothetical protein
MTFDRCPRCNGEWLEQGKNDCVCVSCNVKWYANALLWAFNGLENFNGQWIAQKECVSWYFAYDPAGHNSCLLFFDDIEPVVMPWLPYTITKEELDKLLVLL